MAFTFFTPINNAGAVLAAAHLVADGHLVLDDASVFAAAAPSPSNPIRVCAGSAIFKVVGITGSTLTLDGVLEGTTDIPLPLGTVVEDRVTAGDIKDLQQAIATLDTTTTTIGSGVGGGTANRILYVDGSGNLAQSSGLVYTGTHVGIGTTTPNVSGQQAGTRVLTVAGNASLWGGVEVDSKYSADSQFMGFYGFASSVQTVPYQLPAYIGGWMEGSTTNKLGGNIRFHTQADNMAGAAERMRIGSTGQVVIGSTTVHTDHRLKIVGSDNTDNHGLIVYSNNTTQSLAMGWGGLKASSGLWLEFLDAGGDFKVNRGASTEIIVLGSTGYTGIHETSPGAQLQVTSISASTKTLILKAAASATADIFQAQTSVGTPVMTVGPTGNVDIAGQTFFRGDSYFGQYGDIKILDNSFAIQRSNASKLKFGQDGVDAGFTMDTVLTFATSPLFEVQNAGAAKFTVGLQGDTRIQGDLYLNNTEYIWCKDGGGTYQLMLGFDSGSNYVLRNNASSGSYYLGNNSASNSLGNIYFQNASAIVGQVNPSGNWLLTPQQAGTVGLTVKTFASATANSQEWVKSDGVKLLSVSAAGGFQFHESAVGNLVGTLTGDVNYGGIRLDMNANYPGLAIKVNTSNTNIPFAVKDSTGTTIAAIDAYGSLTVGRTTNGASLTVNMSTAAALSGSYLGARFIAASGSSSQINFESNDSNGGTIFNINDLSGGAGRLQMSFGYANPLVTFTQAGMLLGESGLNPNARLDVRTGDAGKIGVIVKGVATATFTINNVALTSNVATITTSAAHTLQVGRYATVAGLTNSGLNGTYLVTGVTSTTFTFAKTASNITSVADSGTVFGNGQNVDLQRWNDATDTPMGAVSNVGDLTMKGGITGSAYYITGTGGGVNYPNWLTYQIGNSFVIRDATYGVQSLLFLPSATGYAQFSGDVYGTTFNASKQIVATSDAAGTIPLVTKGAVSQTGNLFEARSSVNAVLASIGPDGNFTSRTAQTKTVVKGIGDNVGDWSEFGSFDSTPSNGASVYHIDLAADGSGEIAKTYAFAAVYTVSGVWKKVLPISGSGPYSNNDDFDLEMLANGYSQSFRVRRRVAGTSTTSVTLVMTQTSSALSPFATSTSTGNSGSTLLFHAANVPTTIAGNLGVGIEPIAPITVKGAASSLLASYGMGANLSAYQRAYGTASPFLITGTANANDSSAIGWISMASSYTTPAAGQTLGAIEFLQPETGKITTNASAKAAVSAISQGAGGSSGGYGGCLTFYTTKNDSAEYSERVRIDESGFVGVNEASPGAQMQINTRNASTKALILKLAASASGNAFEIQTSVGTPITVINCAGDMSVKSLTTPYLALDTASNTVLSYDGTNVQFQTPNGIFYRAGTHFLTNYDTSVTYASFSSTATAINKPLTLNSTSGTPLKIEGANTPLQQVFNYTGSDTTGNAYTGTRWDMNGTPTAYLLVTAATYPTTGLFEANQLLFMNTLNGGGVGFMARGNDSNAGGDIFFAIGGYTKNPNEKMRITKDDIQIRVPIKGTATDANVYFQNTNTFVDALGGFVAQGPDTSHARAVFGFMRHQSYSFGNEWIVSNGYYNGSAWTRQFDGYAAGIQFFSGQVMLTGQPSGSGTFTTKVQFKTDSSGAVAIGGDIDPTESVYTGAKMLVAANGNVGIGTLSPAHPLHIVGTTQINGTNNGLLLLGSSFYLQATDGTITNNFGITGTNGFLGTQTAHDLEFRTSNTARLIITAAGLIGANTSSPGAQVQINAKDASTTGLIVQGTVSATANMQEWRNAAGTPLCYVNATGTAVFAAIYQLNSYGTTSIAYDGSTTTIGGNVGVGIAPNIGGVSNSAYRTLTIVGVTTNSSEGAGRLELATQQTDADAALCGIVDFVASAQSSGHKRVAAILSSTDGSTANQRGGNLVFYTKADTGGLAERMRITSSGNVVIGGNLQAAKFSSVTVSNTSLADSTPVTVFAVPHPGVYQVSFLMDANSQTAVCQVGAGAAGTPTILNQNTSGQITFSLSGSNLQITQTSGITSTVNTLNVLRLI